ncbi:dde superfamily endonuclease [Holotrichia oblita]|uniref:Dde superfamily endonuclease n=1 Tax=Holotrichia oblita TaxID=644536 RepID=A0ACB9TQT8_HOLOL|nr:dde superfamily endonuclease [Holotrichia oblita]
MDDIYEQLTDDEDFVELIRIVENRRAPKRYMQRRDIGCLITLSHSVSAEDMVLLTLRFLATGSFLRVAGDIQGIHESTAEETNAVRGGFFEIARLPRRPGSTHDATIFANSHVRALFENGVFQDNMLLGDSGYGIKSYLITPLLKPHSPQEHLFNESQIRTRNPIERCFGIWERRFPILSTGIKLNYDKVESIVLATAVLHNIARQRNEPEDPIDAVLHEHMI